MKKTKISGIIMLLLCAFIWGTAFVAQSEGLKTIGPITFQAIRSYLAGFILLPLVVATDFVKKKRGVFTNTTKEQQKKTKIATVLVGGACGIILAIATILQQIGMATGTSSGNAGFITAMYILLVPVIGLFLKKKVPFYMWLCIAVSVVGLYFLCVGEGGFDFKTSDLTVLACAFVFAIHIVTIDNLAGGLDGIKISCIQFFTSALFSTVLMFFFEKPSLSGMKDGWFALFYTGIMSSGVAYTLQILGQQRTEPTVASLLMSFESVFAVLGTIAFSVVMGVPQYPTSREWIGCALMFAAIIVSQLPLDKTFRKKA